MCMTCPLGDPCPSLYILKGQSYKQSILFGTIFCNLTMHVDQRRAPHVFISWAEPPLMVRPMSAHEGIGVYTPTPCHYGHRSSLHPYATAGAAQLPPSSTPHSVQHAWPHPQRRSLPLLLLRGEDDARTSPVAASS